MLLALFLVLVYIWQFCNLFQSTQHGQKHIFGHQKHPAIIQGAELLLELDLNHVVIGVVVVKHQNVSSMLCKYTIHPSLPNIVQIVQEMWSGIQKNLKQYGKSQEQDLFHQNATTLSSFQVKR